MSLLRLFLFTSLAVYSFVLAVSAAFESREDEMKRLINETQQNTSNIKEANVKLKKMYDKILKDIETEEKSLEGKRAHFTAEENKLEKSIRNLTFIYEFLNHSVNMAKEDIKRFTKKGYRIWFEVTLLKAEYEFYDGLNKSGVQKTCFELLRNKTLPLLIKDLKLLGNAIHATESPAVIALESTLLIARRNFSIEKHIYYYTLGGIEYQEEYLIKLKKRNKHFTKGIHALIDTLKENEKDLINRIKELENILKQLNEKIKNKIDNIKKGYEEVKRYQQLVKQYQSAKRCYKKIKYEFNKNMNTFPQVKRREIKSQ